MPKPGRARGANEERWSGRGQRCCRRAVISDSAVSGTEATGDIGKNCARGWRPLAAISQCIRSTLRARRRRLDGQYVGTNASAHHRVCSCHPRTGRAGCYAPDRIGFCFWIWPTHHGHPPGKTGRFTGHDFPLQPDGTLRCPAGSTLTLQERQEADRSLRLVYGASIRRCRSCELREQCQW